MDYKWQKVSMIYFCLVSANQFSGSHVEFWGFKIWTINAAGNICLVYKLFIPEIYFHYLEIVLFLGFTKILFV